MAAIIPVLVFVLAWALFVVGIVNLAAEIALNVLRRLYRNGFEEKFNCHEREDSSKVFVWMRIVFIAGCLALWHRIIFGR